MFFIYMADNLTYINFISRNKAKLICNNLECVSVHKKKTGKFGMPSDYAPVIYEMILEGYNMFIRNPEVRSILDVLND